MKQCWEPETDDRPSFTELADKMGQYLHTSVKQVMLCAIVKNAKYYSGLLPHVIVSFSLAGVILKILN